MPGYHITDIPTNELTNYDASTNYDQHDDKRYAGLHVNIHVACLRESVKYSPVCTTIYNIVIDNVLIAICRTSYPDSQRELYWSDAFARPDLFTRTLFALAAARAGRSL